MSTRARTHNSNHHDAVVALQQGRVLHGPSSRRIVVVFEMIVHAGAQTIRPFPSVHVENDQIGILKCRGSQCKVLQFFFVRKCARGECKKHVFVMSRISLETPQTFYNLHQNHWHRLQTDYLIQSQQFPGQKSHT